MLYSLRHPNLPRVIDHFFVSGQGQFLVMDYVAGHDLAQVLKRVGPLPEARALAWIEQVLDALAYLHEQNVIHRDVKPSNVKITPEGQVMLVDFGLAKVYDPALSTTIGARGVTPGYAPPEQYGAGRTDARSDLYSVGATLYALLTGQSPPDALELVTGQATWSSPRQLNRAVSSQAEAIIKQAMQIRPTHRFQTAGEFRAALAAPEAPPARQSPQPEVKRSGDVTGDTSEPFTGGRIELDVPLPQPELARPSLPPAQAAQQNQSVALGLGADVELELMRVSAGPFLMGSNPQRDKDAQKDEQPQRTFHLDAYMIGRYPVTNAQYAVFVRSADHRAPEDWKRGRPPSGKEKHPVVRISWDDAAAFCAWLTELLRAARRGSGESLVARLPTEAEWEKAARGTDGRIYPWGDEKPTSRLCNFGNNVKGTTAVGRYSPAGDSPYGCADMAGNVWEWCADWYADDYYAAAPDRNPTGPRDGGFRVLRGGSFDGSDYIVRCASRDWFNPYYRRRRIGFRLVASPFTSGL